MVVGIYFLGYRVVRTEFSLVLSLYSSLFGLMIFWFFYSKKRTVDWKAVFLVGFILRLVLFPSIPLWSEDFARFLWDGELLNLGFNPYLNTPNQWVQLHSEDFSAYLALLYDRMNSPGYYSVYTPFNQFFFWLGAKLGGGSLIPGLLVLKGILIIGEIAVFFLLKSLLIRFGIGSQKLIFYWLNPFVILEVIGNLHFEGLVLLFLLAVLFGLERKHRLVSASFLAFAVGLKLVPLILAPGFLRIRSKQPWFWMGLGVISLVLFLPLLIDQSWRNFFQSLGLYQGKFEFNASIYYLGREVGYWIEGYNTIAYLTKGLSALTLLLILFLAFKKKINQTKDWIELWIGCYWIYLLLQPVVHPWYLIPGLGLSILTKKIGFLVWSLAVILSYQAYGNHCNVEYPIVLVLEYSLVCVGLIYDYRQHYFTFPIKLLKK
ncbi:Protein of unknown function [Algoriphagus hitonicola]|uniref:Mannosyltransferase related to Gpi18 n=2 Tax=Algoriphagus hitonicola TaxID=435880 RepID=A0A1I2TJF1_9BACT|nr:Protein of unknown function [Algoriphagus hitonicola]